MKAFLSWLCGIAFAADYRTMIAMLTEIVIGVGYGLVAGVPMMLAFSWATRALGAVPQPYPVPVRRPSTWTPQPAAVRLSRAS